MSAPCCGQPLPAHYQPLIAEHVRQLRLALDDCKRAAAAGWDTTATEAKCRTLIAQLSTVHDTFFGPTLLTRPHNP